jgi:putative ABC transport system permease protein
MSRDLALGPLVRAVGRQKTAFALMVLELASGFVIISSLLLTGAWYRRTATQPLGYDERELVSLALHVPAASPDPAQAAADARAREAGLLAGVAALPGVAAVAPVSTLLTDEGFTSPALLATSGGAAAMAFAVVTTPALAEVLRLRFLEGNAASSGVVITRSVRDRLWPPGRAAVGQRLMLDDAAPVLVAGVIEDVLMGAPFARTAYQGMFRFDHRPDEREARYLLRVRPGARDQVLAALPAVVGATGPDRVITALPFDSRRNLQRHFAGTVITLLFVAGVTVGAIALLGVLAVSSFVVTQRRRQLGIRRALGATRGDIVAAILIENSLASALGTALGLVGTLVLAVMMRRVFSGLQVDGTLLVATAVILWADCTAAAFLPARRAARTPPSVASRGL